MNVLHISVYTHVKCILPLCLETFKFPQIPSTTLVLQPVLKITTPMIYSDSIELLAPESVLPIEDNSIALPKFP